MTRLIALLLACGLVANAANAESISPDKVKEKAQTCAACHGADGNGTTSQYPRIAGQYHDYLARALHEYKSGERKNPIMAGFAATLSDTEIDALARYFASMPTKLDDLSKYEQGD
ncbi:MAG: c-type cytochrome [Rudaea sp.]